MTTALREAIIKDGRGVNAIGLLTGVDKAMLSRFVRDQRSLTLESADKVCRGLGLEVRLVKPRKGR